MASRREEQREEVRFRVLRLLNENPQLSTRQIAYKVGVSNGAAYYCLTALMEKGFVKLGNFASSLRKRRYAYILTPRGIREKTILTAKFLDRKIKEFEVLKKEIAELEDEVGIEGPLPEDIIRRKLDKDKSLLPSK